MVGYTRQSAAAIVGGSTIYASDFNLEFNALQSAFNATSGHIHDGSTGNGPKLSLTAAVSGILPVVNGGTAASTAADARTSLGTDVANNLTSGILPNARLTGAYTNLTGLTVTNANEALKIISTSDTADPYIAIYKQT